MPHFRNTPLGLCRPAPNSRLATLGRHRVRQWEGRQGRDRSGAVGDAVGRPALNSRLATWGWHRLHGGLRVLGQEGGVRETECDGVNAVVSGGGRGVGGLWWFLGLGLAACE